MCCVAWLLAGDRAERLLTSAVALRENRMRAETWSSGGTVPTDGRCVRRVLFGSHRLAVDGRRGSRQRRHLDGDGIYRRRTLTEKHTLTQPSFDERRAAAGEGAALP